MAADVGNDLRTRTATFLFTDIQGSTRLAHDLGLDRWTAILQTHFRLLRAAVAANGGSVISTDGDSLFAAFEGAADGIRASWDCQKAMFDQPWPGEAAIRVRMGLHTGEAAIVGREYSGFDVHRAARIMSAAHGGQVVLSDSTQELVQDSLPEGLALTDLGAYRLKDLAQPERIWQLTIAGLDEDFPPLRALEVSSRKLPARLSSFIGRKKEMGELRRLFAHTRMLTVLGPGGCGKTRLAVEFARQQEPRFADGCIIVELAALRDPALVGNAIAAAAGLTLTAEDTQAELGRRLREKHLLAVVDNCEHLIDGVAASLARLLEECPQISVLATTRERINIGGETAWRVPSLGLPEAGESTASLISADSVRLFVERARSLRPGFEADAANAAAVGAICRRLDGVPLAIELAASRVTTMSPAEIVSGLEDRFQLLTGGNRNADKRHQTLRAAIDWGYELLSQSERTLLQRLSVFVGSFSNDAAQQICSTAPLEAADVREGLERLVDKSMVQADPDSSGGMRFRLLETIREYAERHLEGGAAEELRDRHLDFYLNLAQVSFQEFKYRAAVEEHAGIWREMADIRAALEWSRRHPERELPLASSLFFIWVMYAPGEGLRRLEEVMARTPYNESVAYAYGAWALGALGGRAGRPEVMALALEDFVKLTDLLDDDFLKCQTFLVRGFTAERRDRDLETARDAFLQAVPAMEKYGFLPTLSLCLAMLGSVEMQLGNLEAARPPILRALEVAREIDDGYMLLGAYYQLGWLDLEGGAIQDARANFMSALELAAPADLLSIAFQVEGLACATVGDDNRRALTLFGAAERMRTEVDSELGFPWVLRVKPDVARAQAALPEADSEAAWRAGLATPSAQVIAGLRRDWSTRKASRTAIPGGLSRREMEVAGLVAEGMTSKAIADRLFLAERTVESHLEHILTKLDFNSRAQVATWFTEQSLAE